MRTRDAHGRCSGIACCREPLRLPGPRRLDQVIMSVVCGKRTRADHPMHVVQQVRVSDTVHTYMAVGFACAHARSAVRVRNTHHDRGRHRHATCTPDNTTPDHRACKPVPSGAAAPTLWHTRHSSTRARNAERQPARRRAWHGNLPRRNPCGMQARLNVLKESTREESYTVIEACAAQFHSTS
jgi:hypothetical protein